MPRRRKEPYHTFINFFTVTMANSPFWPLSSHPPIYFPSEASQPKSAMLPQQAVPRQLCVRLLGS